MALYQENYPYTLLRLCEIVIIVLKGIVLQLQITTQSPKPYVATSSS